MVNVESVDELSADSSVNEESSEMIRKIIVMFFVSHTVP